jgi:flagellar motor switch protein FliG
LLKIDDNHKIGNFIKEKNMATLTKINAMNDTQIQNWLRNVGQENAVKLGMAMLGADEDVCNLIYKNMSPRAASVLKADLENHRKTSFDEQTVIKDAFELEKLI